METLTITDRDADTLKVFRNQDGDVLATILERDERYSRGIFLVPDDARRLHVWLGQYLASLPAPDAKGVT